MWVGIKNMPHAKDIIFDSDVDLAGYDLKNVHDINANDIKVNNFERRGSDTLKIKPSVAVSATVVRTLLNSEFSGQCGGASESLLATVTVPDLNTVSGSAAIRVIIPVTGMVCDNSYSRYFSYNEVRVNGVAKPSTCSPVPTSNTSESFTQTADITVVSGDVITIVGRRPYLSMASIYSSWGNISANTVTIGYVSSYAARSALNIDTPLTFVGV